MSEPKWALGYDPTTLVGGCDGYKIGYPEHQGPTVSRYGITWAYAGEGWRLGRRRWRFFGPRLREPVFFYRPAS